MLKATLLALLTLSIALPARADDDVWSLDLGIDEAIYPSFIIATSTLKLDEEEEPDETLLGDPMGMIGVSITAPSDKASVVVEVSSGTLIRPSRFEGTLPKKGETYWIYPMLKYDFDRLLAVRQPYPEVISAKVTVNKKSLGEQTERVPVRSIHDCVLGYSDWDDEWIDTTWLMAAYVNENHPAVDEILGEALDAGSVNSFAGYQKKPDEVMEEIQAIWDALKERGFKYSNITTASGVSKKVASQHVRLLGDATRTSQANCVEGSVLFASILRKLGMDTFLVLIPGHMFVGVFLDAEQNEHICIETTMLGQSEFEEAVEAGNRQFAEHAEAFEREDEEDAENTGCSLIRIEDARAMGVMPIMDSASSSSKSK